MACSRKSRRSTRKFPFRFDLYVTLIPKGQGDYSTVQSVKATMWTFGPQLALLFSLRHRAEIIGPMLGRAKPVLQFGHKFVALMEGAYANRVNLWPVLDRRRIDWRSTIWTKRLLPLGAAFGCLDVYFRFT